MWTQLIQKAQSRMNNSAKQAQRNDNLISAYQKREQETMRNDYSVKPLQSSRNKGHYL